MVVSVPRSHIGQALRRRHGRSVPGGREVAVGQNVGNERALLGKELECIEQATFPGLGARTGMVRNQASHALAAD